MQIIPIAVNHILMKLDSGAILDINDGTQQCIKSGGSLHIKLDEAYKIEKNRAGVRVYLSTGTRDAFSAELEVYETATKISNTDEKDFAAMINRLNIKRKSNGK